MIYCYNFIFILTEGGNVFMMMWFLFYIAKDTKLNYVNSVQVKQVLALKVAIKTKNRYPNPENVILHQILLI